VRRSGSVLLLPFVFLAQTAHPQGMPQGPEFRVNTYTTGGQGGPWVVADDGGFVVVWSSAQDGSGSGVIGQRYSSSGSLLGAEFRINTYTIANQVFASAASDASGNFVVTWMSDGQDGSSSGIFGQRYAASGSPLGPEFRINSYTTNTQQTPSVAAEPSGSFVVVWNSYGQDGSGFGVFGQRYDGSGAPLGSEFRINTYTTDAQFAPAVAVDPAGTFLVVWSSGQDGSPGAIFGQRYSASGAPLGSEFRINTYTTGNQYDPSVSASAGVFVVVWNSDSQDGSYSGVFGQRYASSGAPLGGEFRVNTYTAFSQAWPSTAVDGSGNFVVVWASPYDGSVFGIFGQRYASSGVALGPEFRANTYTTGQQVFPVVAADSTGRFVIAWTSDAQDGSGYGVFGQRYSPIVPVELMRFGVE
jgi:hypothetical protein